MGCDVVADRNISMSRLQLGADPLVFFAAMMVVQFVHVLFFFPETKQISLEELQEQLKIV